MTKKQDLQKEILAKVKPGMKPSDLKKLKRSKSADDIPNTKSSDSNTAFTNPTQALNTLTEELKKQADLNSLLAEQLDQKQTDLNSQLQQINCLFDPQAINYTQPINFTGLYQHLKEILTNSPPQSLLLDQLKAKQKELENLRKQLEQVNQKLTQTTAELDNSLAIRHQSLKDWNKQQEAIKSLNKELNETIDQASEEIIAGDDTISSLRTKIYQLKTAKENLEKDLKLASRLAEIRKVPLPDSSDNSTDNLLSYIPYSLLAIWFILLLTNSEKLTVSARLNNKIYD